MAKRRVKAESVEVQEERKRRDAYIHVRCGMAEKAQVEAAALEAGMELPDYVRWRLMMTRAKRGGVRVPTEIRADLVRVLGQLGKIGSNVNQLAKVANAKGEVPAVLVLEESHKALMETLLVIRGMIR